MLKYLNVGTQAGAFMILPTTFEPGQEATFTFRLLLIFLLLLWSFLSFFCGCYCLIWYNFCSTRVLSHGQAKLKSVDSTPAIIKSAIVKVSNTFAKKKTPFWRRRPLWRTRRVSSSMTHSSCNSRTIGGRSMPLSSRLSSSSSSWQSLTHRP